MRVLKINYAKAEKIMQKFGESHTPAFNNQEEITGLLERKNILQKQLQEINDKLDELQKLNNNSFIKDDSKIESKEVKFFGGKYNGILTDEVYSSSSAKFKVFDIKGSEALFEYCGGAINEDWFEDTGNIINPINEDVRNKTKIITIKPGTVRKDNQNNWKIQQKAEIEYQ